MKEITDVATIRTADWSINPAGSGQILTDLDDIGACLLRIWNTPRFSNALRPTFGCEIWRHIDKPIDIAVPLIRKEMIESANEWEPRAEITSITHVVDVSTVTFTAEFKFATLGLTKTVNFTITK